MHPKMKKSVILQTVDDRAYRYTILKRTCCDFSSVRVDNQCFVVAVIFERGQWNRLGYLRGVNYVFVMFYFRKKKGLKQIWQKVKPWQSEWSVTFVIVKWFSILVSIKYLVTKIIFEISLKEM